MITHMDDALTVVSNLAIASESIEIATPTTEVNIDLDHLSKHSQYYEYTVSGEWIGSPSYLLYPSVSTALLLLRYVTVHERFNSALEAHGTISTRTHTILQYKPGLPSGASNSPIFHILLRLGE